MDPAGKDHKGQCDTPFRIHACRSWVRFRRRVHS